VYQTLDGLRKLNPAVLVCFMSGDTGAYHPEELGQRGAVHVIAKPFRMEQLISVLRWLVQEIRTDLLSPGEECQG
jgi:hypothetical protein